MNIEIRRPPTTTPTRTWLRRKLLESYWQCTEREEGTVGCVSKKARRRQKGASSDKKQDAISNNKRQAKASPVNKQCSFLQQNHLQARMKQKIETTADVYTTREMRKFAFVHQMAPKKKWNVFFLHNERLHNVTQSEIGCDFLSFSL